MFLISSARISSWAKASWVEVKRPERIEVQLLFLKLSQITNYPSKFDTIKKLNSNSLIQQLTFFFLTFFSFLSVNVFLSKSDTIVSMCQLMFY